MFDYILIFKIMENKFNQLVLFHFDFNKTIHDRQYGFKCRPTGDILPNDM